MAFSRFLDSMQEMFTIYEEEGEPLFDALGTMNVRIDSRVTDVAGSVNLIYYIQILLV